MKIVKLWPFFVAGGLLLVADVGLWWAAAKRTGDVKTVLVSSASSLLVALVTITGAGIGTYFASSFSVSAAKKAEQRAAYASFLVAAAAYSTQWTLWDKATKAVSASASPSRAATDLATEKLAALNVTETGLRVAAAAVVLIGPDSVVVLVRGVEEAAGDPARGAEVPAAAESVTAAMQLAMK
jgi:hypothetical protein